VLALAGAIIWLTPSTPTPKAVPAADTTSVPTSATAPSAAATSPTQQPRHTRTARPEPQSESTPSALPTTDRLTLGALRPGGGRQDGECRSGEVTLQALVTRTGGPVTVRYTWIVDGTVAGRSSATLAENGRRLLTSPTTLTTPGTHSVTLRITEPVTRQRTIPITICDDALQ